LGGSAETGCAATTDVVVHGGLDASNATAVMVHGATIDGGLSVEGGGGYDDCTTNLPGLPFPPFSNVEDSVIHGGASFVGLTTCWMGVIRNEVSGGVTINGNTLGDTDAIEVGLNSIHGTLACSGNQLDAAVPPDLNPADHAGNGTPSNFFDGVGPNPNTVTGHETGQCAGL
jgi:hypothetical protein